MGIELSTLETIPNTRVIKHFGMVQGNTVRAKHVGRDIMAGLKTIVGGEIKGYTELLSESREEALYRLSENAQRQGANAVVNIRFSTSSITDGALELLAYGTAVFVEPYEANT